MADPWSDDRLDLVLASVGEHLVLPAPPETSVSPGARHRRPVRALVAVAAAVVLLAAATMLNPVQDAIADVLDWLDIGSTRVERTEPARADPAGLQPITAGLPAASRTEAERALGGPLPPTARLGLGAPDEIALPPEGGALLAWKRDATSLWVRPTDDPPEIMIQKLLDEFDTVERVTRLGDLAVYVGGDHVLVTPHRRAAADSVVLWVDDGFEYRLESEAGRSEMLAMSRALARGTG
jgi:hypothetical protein